MASTQIKVFSFGRWINFGSPQQYHVAVDLAAQLRKAGVIVGLNR